MSLAKFDEIAGGSSCHVGKLVISLEEKGLPGSGERLI